MNHPNSDNVTVVVLAGGKGRRMEGMDKGLLPFRGRTLIDHVLDAIGQQTNRIVINANRNLDDYAVFGYPVVADTLTDFQGPLAGFLAAMSVVSTEYILTLPCDGPVIAENYLQKMIQPMTLPSTDMVVASDGNRLQPVYALIPLGLKQSLMDFLDEGGRKIDVWYGRHEYAVVDFPPDSGMFININSQRDLARYS